MHTTQGIRLAFVLATFAGLAGLAGLGCSSSSGSSSSGTSGATSSSSSGGSSGATSSSGTSGSNPGSCSGDITACTLGSLSDTQRNDMCTVTLAAIDAPSGTKYECTSGPNSGLNLTINSKATCEAQKYPASCAITVQQLLDCYKGAKTDACTALDAQGVCGKVFAQSKACAG